MSTLPNPINSTTNPFITGGGSGTGSQKHYEEMTWTGDTSVAGVAQPMFAYAARPGYPTKYKNLTGVIKTCRFGSAGHQGVNTTISQFVVSKNNVPFETIVVNGWPANDSTVGWSFSSPLVIAANDEITVTAELDDPNSEDYFTMQLEWDGDIP